MLPYPAAGVAAAAAIVVYVLYSVEHEPDHHVDELEWVIDGAMDAGAASVLGGEPLRFRLPNAGRAMALWAKASMVRRQRTLPNVCASRERFITYCDRELVGGCGHRLVASLPAEEILDGSCGDPDGRTHCSFSGDPQLFERTMHQALLGLEPALGAAGLELGTARRNVWVGGSNVTTTLHYDGVHNLFVQLHGSKRFLLLPPVAWLYVYPTPYSLSRQRQSAIPGELLDHCLRTGSPPPGHDKTAMARDLPLLAMWCGLNRTEVQPMLRPLSVVLRAGDVLYLPVRAWATASGAPRVSHAASQPFWYHHVISLSSSVSASWWVQATEVEAASQVEEMPLPLQASWRPGSLFAAGLALASAILHELSAARATTSPTLEAHPLCNGTLPWCTAVKHHSAQLRSPNGMLEALAQAYGHARADRNVHPTSSPDSSPRASGAPLAWSSLLSRLHEVEGEEQAGLASKLGETAVRVVAVLVRMPDGPQQLYLARYLQTLAYTVHELAYAQRERRARPTPLPCVDSALDDLLATAPVKEHTEEDGRRRSAVFEAFFRALQCVQV